MWFCSQKANEMVIKEIRKMKLEKGQTTKNLSIK